MESAVQALYMVSVVQRRVWWCLVICQTGAWMDGMDEGVGGWVVRRKKERKKERERTVWTFCAAGCAAAAGTGGSCAATPRRGRIVMERRRMVKWKREVRSAVGMAR